LQRLLTISLNSAYFIERGEIKCQYDYSIFQVAMGRMCKARDAEKAESGDMPLVANKGSRMLKPIVDMSQYVA